MSNRYFRRWNWEQDVGEEELQADACGPAYAVASYDWAGRVYRVTVTRASPIEREPDCAPEYDTFVYDYCCDDSGRVIDKRSLDDYGNIDCIIRYLYDDAAGTVTEIGWDPSGDSEPRQYARDLREHERRDSE